MRNILAIVSLVIIVIAAVGISRFHGNKKMSDLELANIEALANGSQE